MKKLTSEAFLRRAPCGARAGLRLDGNRAEARGRARSEIEDTVARIVNITRLRRRGEHGCFVHRSGDGCLLAEARQLVAALESRTSAVQPESLPRAAPAPDDPRLLKP